MFTNSIAIATAALATLASLAVPAQAQAPTKLTIMVFTGMQNLPLFAAQSHGFFTRRGLEVEIKTAPNSEELRNGLAEGRLQIVHSGSDNAVALVENAGVDAKIVIGGDDAMNRVFLQQDVAGIADLRGKKVAVDAPNTSYAFQLYEILRLNGLQRGDYEVVPVGATMKRADAVVNDRTLAATMLNPPFSFRVARAGLKDMGEATRIIGPYQGSAGFVLGPWAKANEETLVRYLAAYVAGQRWAMAATNRDAAISLLETNLKIPRADAEAGYAALMTSMAPDAALDHKGFETVLGLRARHTGKPTKPAAAYLDLSYHKKALALASAM